MNLTNEIRIMSDGGYKIRNKKEVHFITFAVVESVDVFARREYRDIVIESLKYCQKDKGLLLHGWCIMSNHVHLIASAKNEDLSNILRDFKKFTSKRLLELLKRTNMKAEKTGCWPYSNRKLKKIATTPITNFGDKTTNPWNYILLASLCKN